jgi:hypothetical protein
MGGGEKYDELYNSLCDAMNRRICQSKCLNLPTYPGELIYIPDMLVAIVALDYYSRQHNGKYSDTVNMWVERAKKEWIDKETGLLTSFLAEDADNVEIVLPVKGSYSALNCYYLSLVNPEFAKEQYEQLKRYAEFVWQSMPDGPERDAVIEEILIGMSEAKRRFDELNDEQL